MRYTGTGFSVEKIGFTSMYKFQVKVSVPKEVPQSHYSMSLGKSNNSIKMKCGQYK